MLHVTVCPPPHTHTHINTQPDHFPFLNVAHSNLDLGCRTLFYVALARLLLVELGESEEKFERFISPLNCEWVWVGGWGLSLYIHVHIIIFVIRVAIT